MLKNVFKHTLFYGIATVLPRILTVFLTPLYVSFLPQKSDYGIYATLMVYMIFGNVLLSYGMETTYFRFVNKHKNKSSVERTALTSILWTTILFLLVVLFFSGSIADYLHYKRLYILDVVLILSMDALLVVPFAWLRNNEKSTRFAVIRISNVIINILLNILLLVILKDSTYISNDKVHLIFIALLIPSFLTFLSVLYIYRLIGLGINKVLLKRMLNYSYPILVAGLAFAVNEGLDKVLLRYMLPIGIADEKVGVYSACYKLGAFMALFTAAFKLGIEPFFFKQADKSDAKKIYEKMTYYFIILGCFILIFVCTYIDIIKHILIPKEAYWEGLWIVPIILIANLFLGIYHNLSIWYKIKDKTIYGALFSVIGAIITLGLNFMLIPSLGFRGSAIATLVAYGVMMLLSFLFGRSNYRIAYPIKKILFILTSAIGLSLLSFYTFERNLYMGSFMCLVFILEIYIIEMPLFKKLIKNVLKIK